MTYYDDVEQYEARYMLSKTEIRKMEHCIGYNPSKVYRRKGKAYFKPYRNHFSPGGSDIPIWENLKLKGFAECGEPDKRDGLRTYWLTLPGLSILSAAEEVYIYSDVAQGNEIDAQYPIIDILLDDLVYCGYGCWIPSGAKEIAKRARLPLKLTLDTLHYLERKPGYVTKTSYEGCDDEGFPYCYHGWTLTKAWRDNYSQQYEEARKAESARINAMNKSHTGTDS